MTFENAFHLILPIVDRYKTEILDAMERESDTQTKAKFIELLGHCKDESLIVVFKNELKNRNEEIVNWCLFALENNPSKEGHKIAKEFRKKNPRFSDDEDV